MPCGPCTRCHWASCPLRHHQGFGTSVQPSSWWWLHGESLSGRVETNMDEKLGLEKTRHLNTYWYMLWIAMVGYRVLHVKINDQNLSCLLHSSAVLFTTGRNTSPFATRTVFLRDGTSEDRRHVAVRRLRRSIVQCGKIIAIHLSDALKCSIDHTWSYLATFGLACPPTSGKPCSVH